MSRVHTLTHVFSGYNGIKAEDISLLEVSTALSNLCRFNGQISSFYSVAEHSILTIRALEMISIDVSVNLQKIALLHDANEAYLGDVVLPFKKYLLKLGVTGLKEMFNRFQKLCYESFNVVVTEEEAEIVKLADSLLLSAEGELFFPNTWRNGLGYRQGKIVELKKLIECLNPEEAKYKFVETFNQLFTGDNNEEMA